MSKNINTTQIALGIAIALIQVLDILLHAATNQLEGIRFASNLIILTWLAFGRLYAKLPSASPTAFSLVLLFNYLLLNILFLASEGLTNVEQGGGLRVPLFLLVSLTTLLSLILIYMRKQRSPK